MRPFNLLGHERPLTQVLFNYAGDILFSCAKDSVINAWDVSDGSLLGNYLPFGDSDVDKVIWSIDVTLDGKTLIAGTAEGVFIFDVETFRILHHYDLGAVCRCVAWNTKPCDQTRFVCARDALGSYKEQGILVYKWDEEKRDYVIEHEYLDYTPRCNKVAFGPYDETLISVHDVSTKGAPMIEWDLATGKRKFEKEVHTDAITCIDFTRDRALCLTTSKDCTAKLWSVPTWTEIQTFTTDRPLNGGSISPLFDKEDGTQRLHVIVGGGQEASQVTTTKSQEGKQEAILMHIVTGETLGLISGHFSPINSIIFMPDGQGFATGAEEALKINPWGFKFRPDFDNATLEFSEAAKCFQAEGNHTRAISALEGLAQTRKLEGDMFGAGRSFESVAHAWSSHFNDWSKSCVALSEAAECYQLAGKPDSAYRVWTKVAEMQENRLSNTSQASEAYRKCIEIGEIEESDHNVVDSIKRFVGFLARQLLNGNQDVMDELFELLSKQALCQKRLNQNGSFPKTIACKVLLRLFKDDIFGAKREIEQGAILSPQFVASKEMDFVSKLVETWESRDMNAAQNLLLSSTATYLPLEFAKMARLLVGSASLNTSANDTVCTFIGSNNMPNLSNMPSNSTPEDVAQMLM